MTACTTQHKNGLLLQPVTHISFEVGHIDGRVVRRNAKTMNQPEDPFDLSRFLEAQDGVYERALNELQNGEKATHWMWFVFPQMIGLGSSPMACRYAIKSRAEAGAYLRHPVLGPRLTRCADELLKLDGKSAQEIMGSPDDIKLRSSMTLFAAIASSDSVFREVLDRFFDGRPDQRTLGILADEEDRDVST